MTRTADHKTLEERLQYAKVLVELGDLHDAEIEVADILDDQPDNLTALSLFAKIKHMRGELSQAIACWAQIHARSPHNEVALMHLGGILHLAKDPEGGAGEFLALGQFQLARKPTAHLELEEAFRLFLARRPNEARAHCKQLARKYEAKDREIYKLAILASAWIADLSGELDSACATLEDLGKERGFEDDIDRILSLVRIYERLGTPEKLQAAVNIFRHIEDRFEKISVQNRLAGLYQRVGKTDLAKQYGERFLASFRRRMHRPTLWDVVSAAARTYLPLERLRALTWTDATLPPDLLPRERALAAAVSGDLAKARQGLSAGTSLLDRKYLADLEAIEGRTEHATARFLEALREDPMDRRVLGWLLDRPVGPAVREHFRRPEVALQVRELLEADLRSAPLRAQTWRHLATLLGLQPDLETEAARYAWRAVALAEAERKDQHPIGRVLAAGVYHFVGKAKGLIHQIWAGRQPALAGRGGWLADEQILGNLTPEMKQGVRNTFLAVREYARTKFPHLTGDILDYNYTYKVTKEDEPSGGLSAGLPTAIAFLSVFLQRTVPQDLASSGVLVQEAHDVLTVRSVGEADFKVKAVYNRNMRMIILPLGNRTELGESVLVPRSVCDEIVRYAANLDDAVRLVFGEDLFLWN